MDSRPSEGLAPGAWNQPTPDREAMVGLVGRQLLMGLAVILAVVALWAFTTGPQLTNSDTDVTTTLPGAAADPNRPVQFTP